MMDKNYAKIFMKYMNILHAMIADLNVYLRFLTSNCHK